MRSVHKWRWMLVYVGLLPMLMCMGCGKQPDIPELPAEQSGETTGRGAAELRSTGTLPGSAFPEMQAAQPAAVPGGQPDVQASGADTPPIPVRVAALIQQLDGDVRAGLVSKDEEQHAVVGIGDRFMGYELVAADVSKGEVVLQLEGTRYVLGVERSALPAAAHGATGENEHRPMAPVLSAPPIGEGSPTVSDMGSGMAGAPVMPSFVATPREKKLGIDPNDPSTWKPGYLGPGIERAAKAIPEYEPTADEAQKGIDPNDPSTWPAEYRGPGIERAAAEAGENTPAMGHEE